MDVATVGCPLLVAAGAFGCAWTATGGSWHVLARVGRVARVPTAGLWGRDGPRMPGPLARERKRRRLRQAEVDAARDMPTFLDIVCLGISAGLSFDASLELYCDRYQTTLARMMADAMLSWRMGVSGRAEALQELAARTDSAAMARFAAAVTDALAFGTPLAEALERQAQVIRDEQRAQTEEEIERVPVKMLIPMGTLVVPAMLISILGPLLAPALGVA